MEVDMANNKTINRSSFLVLVLLLGTLLLRLNRKKSQ